MTDKFEIDPLHDRVDVLEQDLVRDVWQDKYRFGDEATPHASMERVVHHVYDGDSEAHAELALEAMKKLLWLPGGRIQAGAGTGRRVSLLNCFHSGDIPDDLDGIFTRLKEAALTQQQGGGIGMNFSTIRPSGARLVRTGSFASGPVSFMGTWDAMCQTIMSAGARRGAMMSTLSCSHPDVLKFIWAKREKGVLTNFNVSVLVTDEFMQAVADNKPWDLWSYHPRLDGNHIDVVTADEHDQPDHPRYVYHRLFARDLWKEIIKNTYEYAEPGIMFIDRINKMNNLSYCETILGSNPCSEQYLPAFGCCNLGAINLARVVRKPFTRDAHVDFDLIDSVAEVGTRFLDNVIDRTNYPLPEQQHEEMQKRRIGVGVTGLANMLQQLGIKYGSPDSVALIGNVMQRIAQEVYATSAALAVERGPFPLYREQWLNTPFVRRVLDVTDLLAGVRNGVMLTVAPTGTTSVYAGNVSSGIEPVFSHSMRRKVLQADGSRKEYTAYDYGLLLYAAHAGRTPSMILSGATDLPQTLDVTTDKLTVEEHLQVQAAVQYWIDSGISKTCNVPKEISLEEFGDVYLRAYELGLKGCTTYRPSGVRGSVLESASPEKPTEQPTIDLVSHDPRKVQPGVLDGRLTERPRVLSGKTYKVRWPSSEAAFYVTINDLVEDGGVARPFELFVATRAAQHLEWLTAISRLVSAILRRGGDIDFVHEELRQIHSAVDGGFVGGRHVPSLVAMIGDVIRDHIYPPEPGVDPVPADPRSIQVPTIGEVVSRAEDQKADYALHADAVLDKPCPRCGARAMVAREGCKTCTECGYSSCS